MDYPYFTAAPQPYQFLGLPPTPAHTGSANSDDFSNSPPVRPEPFSYVSYQSPHNLTSRQDAFDQFQTYDYSQQFPQNGLPQPTPPTPQHKPSITANNGFDMQMDMNADEMRRGSNSDDDDNMTPAQSRRKAQNRAAYVLFSSPSFRLPSPSPPNPNLLPYILRNLTSSQPTRLPRTQRTPRQRPRSQARGPRKKQLHHRRRKLHPKSATPKSRHRERDPQSHLLLPAFRVRTLTLCGADAVFAEGFLHRGVVCA